MIASPCCAHAEEARCSCRFFAERDDNCEEEYVYEALQLARQPKSQLTRRWTFWHFKHFSEDTWNSDRNWLFCKEIAPVDTMNDFVTLYKEIRPASGLSNGDAYYFLREFVRPSWVLEPGVVVGGRWSYVIDTQHDKKALDQCWLQTVMAMIDGRFGDCGEYTCGCTLYARSADAKLSLWMDDADKPIIRQLGMMFKELLGIRDTVKYEQRGSEPGAAVHQPNLPRPLSV